MNNLINLNDSIEFIILHLNYDNIINLFYTNKYFKKFLLYYFNINKLLLCKIILFDARIIYNKKIALILDNIIQFYNTELYLSKTNTNINTTVNTINYYLKHFDNKIKYIKKNIKMICIDNNYQSIIFCNKIFVIKLINKYKMSLKYFPYLHNDFEICNLILNNSSNYCYNNFKYCSNFYNDLDFVLNVINKNPECYYYLINNDNVQEHIKYNTTIINTVLCNQNSCYLIKYIPHKLINKKYILSLKHNNIWISQFINNYCIY